MSMNKKEQAEFAAAKKAVIVARALNWREPVLPDVDIPKAGGRTQGFTYNTHSATIMYAISSSVSHATGWSEFPAKTSSQRPLSMYSTKLRALKALRHAVEKECAEKLANIDVQIQVEKEFWP